MVEKLHDDDVDNWQQNSEADGILASVDVHVHHVYMLDLAIKIHFIVVDKKFIVLFPCFDMLLQVG
jgi:hypothetical protein